MSVTIVGIKFKNSCKVYYFSPENISFSEGDAAIVETARGTEYGEVVLSNREVDDKDVVQPLKPVLRKATDADKKQVEKNLAMRPEAIRIANEKIEKHNLNMKLVDVEYTFDRQKIIFYFTAAGRVDFRDLVKDLAGVFRNRIELRQIYERDDAKMRGALAPCGRPCCCNTCLPDFAKVSIKMAKLQGLSLNPTKNQRRLRTSYVLLEIRERLLRRNVQKNAQGRQSRKNSRWRRRRGKQRHLKTAGQGQNHGQRRQFRRQNLRP